MKLLTLSIVLFSLLIHFKSGYSLKCYVCKKCRNVTEAELQVCDSMLQYCLMYGNRIQGVWDRGCVGNKEVCNIFHPEYPYKCSICNQDACNNEINLNTPDNIEVIVT